jgi:hypothetical protein
MTCGGSSTVRVCAVWLFCGLAWCGGRLEGSRTLPYPAAPRKHVPPSPNLKFERVSCDAASVRPSAHVGPRFAIFYCVLVGARAPALAAVARWRWSQSCYTAGDCDGADWRKYGHKSVHVLRAFVPTRSVEDVEELVNEFRAELCDASMTVDEFCMVVQRAQSAIPPPPALEVAYSSRDIDTSDVDESRGACARCASSRTRRAHCHAWCVRDRGGAASAAGSTTRVQQGRLDACVCCVSVSPALTLAIAGRAVCRRRTTLWAASWLRPPPCPLL